jgi:hypothetical protein
MPYDKHDTIYRSLQERYLCKICDPSGGRWCWKQQFKGWNEPSHRQLNSTLLSSWATAIIDHGASEHYPPRIPEFDDIILEPLYKKNPRHMVNVNSVNSVNLLMSQVGNGITREFHFVHGGGNPWDYERKQGSFENNASLCTPARRRQKAVNNASSSPVSSITTLDVEDGVSLKEFQKWCQKVHQVDYDWTEVFDILRDADVGLDSFSNTMGKKTKASKLVRLCASGSAVPLKIAAAERLCKAHMRWIKKGKPIFEVALEVSTDLVHTNITMTKLIFSNLGRNNFLRYF